MEEVDKHGVLSGTIKDDTADIGMSKIQQTEEKVTGCPDSLPASCRDLWRGLVIKAIL